MTCKHFRESKIDYTAEVGGAVPTPRNLRIPNCNLERKPVDHNWVSKCQNTDQNGPCWLWQDKNTGLPDPDF